MTPILARFGTALLIGAASFVNLHPCAATAAERPGGRIIAVANIASAGVPTPHGRPDREVTWSERSAKGQACPIRVGGQRRTASASSRDLPRTA